MEASRFDAHVPFAISETKREHVFRVKIRGAAHGLAVTLGADVAALQGAHRVEQVEAVLQRLQAVPLALQALRSGTMQAGGHVIQALP